MARPAILGGEARLSDDLKEGLRRRLLTTEFVLLDDDEISGFFQDPNNVLTIQNTGFPQRKYLK